MSNKKFKFYTSACGASNGNFLECLGFEHTKDIKSADLVIFGGGADVSPDIYGEPTGKDTYTSPQREKEELRDFNIARELNIKMAGICRGHQFLVAKAGGKLIQDVTGHGGNGHSIQTFDGFKLNTNSIHHQMVNPYNMHPGDYKILAWSSHRRSKWYMGGNNKTVYLPIEFKEIEAIYLPKINAIGWQYHPEMMNYSKDDSTYSPIMNWTRKHFMKFFNNEM